MPPDTKSVEEIAAGLSKHERYLLANYDDGEWHWTCYGPGTRALRKQQLVTAKAHRYFPRQVKVTDLGRAVAAVVGEQQHK